MKFKIFHLNKRANNYLIRELEGRRALAKAALRALDLESGTVTALLPKHYEEPLLYRFTSGWALPACADLADTLEPRSALIEEIRIHLIAAQDSFVVIEDGVGRPDDPELVVAKNLFFHKQDVFHFLAGKQDAPFAEQALLDANVFPGRLGFLTSLPGADPTEFNRAQVDNEFLNSIAGRTTTLFLEAYDSQSFLLWHRN